MKQHQSEQARSEETIPPGSSRRTFIKILGGALAFFLGLGGGGKALKARELLRPPGGQDEANFIAKCLKCDRCRSVCHTSVIGPANLADGLLDARTPVM